MEGYIQVVDEIEGTKAGGTQSGISHSIERAKKYELEIERAPSLIKDSEREKTQLQEELLATKEKLEDIVKPSEELHLNKKTMEEQILIAEKYKSQTSSLQEALQTQEAQQKELKDVNDALNGLKVELENSRMRMQELEQDVQSSLVEAQKFEEKTKQISSHAELETQKAYELERMLELAKLSAKEMENQMSSVQDELKDMYNKIAENQKVDEALRATAADLSVVQGELEFSKSQVSDLQKWLGSEEDLKNELNQELSEDILALENLLASTKDGFQSKIKEFDEINMKLHEEVNMKQMVEGRLKTQEEHKEELITVVSENLSLETTVKDFNANVSKLKELCGDLVTKLKLSDENFRKTDSLLSEALSNNADLEQKFKSITDLHQESGTLAASASQKNLELGDILKASNAAVEDANNDSERELKEVSKKSSELNAMLKGVEEEKMSCKTRNLNMKIRILQRSVPNMRTMAIQLELDELIKISQSKADNAGSKVAKMELLMETSNYRIKELEEQISTLETKCNEKEEELKKFSNREMYFKRKLHILKLNCKQQTRRRRQKFQDMSNSSSAKLPEAENMLREKLDNVEQNLKASGIKVAEILEKHKSAEVQLENQEKAIEQATTKSSELESSYESPKKETAVKLQEATVNFTNRDSEATTLFEKMGEAGQSLSDNEMLAETNIQLKSKIGELEERLSSSHLTDQHSRASEVHTTESRVKETEVQLREAIERFTQKDSEAKDSIEKLSNFESQMKIYDEATNEASVLAQKQKSELEEARLKVKHLESILQDLELKASQFEKENEELAVANLKLTQELAEHESKVSIVTEERNTLYKTHHVERKELAEKINKLEGQQSEQKQTEDNLKAEVESLKTEAAEKSVVQARVLEQQLTMAEAQLKEKLSLLLRSLLHQTHLLPFCFHHYSHIQKHLMQLQQTLLNLFSNIMPILNLNNKKFIKLNNQNHEIQQIKRKKSKKIEKLHGIMLCFCLVRQLQRT
ncbi:hypothetical protein ACHQM5_004142 [Ranunculus cassubicifolius]